MNTKKGLILDELKFNQLSKESMSQINGTDIWDYNWSACTPTGKLYHWIDSDVISHLAFEKRTTDLDEIIEKGDNKAIVCPQ